MKDLLTPDLRRFLGGPSLFDQRDLSAEAASVHEGALATLARLHDLPVQDAGERARIYRDELLGSPAYRQLKEAMDLWCACWFWPADRLDEAPLPTTLAAPLEPTRTLAERLAAKMRFFHWELEFPDVFRAHGAGFDAVLGNPPWETLQPNSKEYFSNIDPLYRAYGKQEALRCQTTYFADEAIEHNWLDFNAGFACYSNWMKCAAGPFGDPDDKAAGGDRFAIARGRENEAFHARWREARAKSRSYAEAEHPFRHRGEGKAYTYKLFLEQAYALLRLGGRLGFIVPSGLYSDHGTGGLRELFLDHCRWEWLFGFENRDGIFDIHRSFKFNPLVIEKGGRTAAIRTAFMRRALEDWERAEELAVPYAREQVERFSPRSRAILEIQSARDLEILEKIYANSVLLGDDGPDGWGVKYAQGDFNMTSDSKLFPPRPWWEERGYRPDEYSRWLKGDWRPIAELWGELGVDSGRVVPVEVELEEWLFDTSAGPERRMAEARFALGHLLKPGDAARTDWRLRCAQPPYDSLPVPRADIPAGIILAREAEAWIREERVEDVALPLYEGRMIGQFDFSQKGWVSGKGRGAVWRDIPWERKVIEPQYLMDAGIYRSSLVDAESGDSIDAPSQFLRTAFMDVTSATNSRTVIASCVPMNPCGNKVPVLQSNDPLTLSAMMSSFAFDFVARRRLTGLSLNYFILEELALPLSSAALRPLETLGLALSAGSFMFASEWVRAGRSDHGARSLWHLSESARLRARCMADALVMAAYGLSGEDARYLVIGDGVVGPTADPKGFWRVDKDKDPELRPTVLSIVALGDLEERIHECAGDRGAGIESFLGQNDGEGWLLPETLRLADYGLGHDERAHQPQPVASRLGPRLFGWQLVQSAEESWRECHLHARHLLGERGYRDLLDEIELAGPGQSLRALVSPADSRLSAETVQGSLFPQHEDAHDKDGSE